MRAVGFSFSFDGFGPIRWRSIATILAAVLLLPIAQVHAQEIGGGGESSGSGGVVSPPPERLLVSPGGVDMRSGEYVYEQTDVSIGEDSEQGGLALTRSMKADVLGHVSPFGNFAHNWEIMITEKMVSVLEGNYTAGSGSDQFMGIHFGGRSESFQSNIYSGSGYEQVSRNTQARLTVAGPGSNAVFTYRGADGTLAVFRPIGNSDCSSIYRCAYVSHIVLPDGTRFDFTYENPTPGVANTTRLRRVTSTRGYALLLEYDAASWNHVSKSCVFNLAISGLPANNICPSNASATANYSYSGVGMARRLASVTDPLGAVSGFTYTPVANGNFACPIASNGTIYGAPATGTQMGFVRPGEATPWLNNSYGERQNNDGLTEEIVYRQDFADGSRYEYCYVESPLIEGQIPTIAGGSYANALGERVTLEFDFPYYPYTTSPTGGPYGVSHPPHFWCCDIKVQVTPGPTRVTDALGRVTITDYCDPIAMANLPPSEHHRCIVLPVPIAVTSPEGIRTEMVWDMQARNLLQSRQKAMAGAGLADIVSSSIFDCAQPINCAKPTSHTDARGNVTNYTYSPVHGGVLTETGPAVDVVSATGTVTAGVRPQTRNAYVQRTAWISNGSGGYVQAATPIWLLALTSSCRTSAATGNPSAPCAVTGDEVLTTYDYGPDSGPNNLLLRGQVVSADGSALRTCYGYDQRGRRISETQPNANLTSCP
jgi:YD repeat-containing protein